MIRKTWIGYNKVHHKKAKLKSVDRALSACTKCGFSLVEMLMALLVASLLMAALAPVMTKKMHENLVITGTGGAVIPTSSCDYVTAGVYGENGECTVPSNIYEAGFS